MNDLISRQQAIDKINERQRMLIYCFGFENDVVKVMDIAKSIITAMPPVQPKRGKWERTKDGVYCSECFLGWDFITGAPGDIESKYRFCPSCGADMREGEQDE